MNVAGMISVSCSTVPPRTRFCLGFSFATLLRVLAFYLQSFPCGYKMVLVIPSIILSQQCPSKKETIGEKTVFLLWHLFLFLFVCDLEEEPSLSQCPTLSHLLETGHMSNPKPIIIHPLDLSVGILHSLRS